MIGQHKGAASLLVRHCEAAGHTQPIHKVHCIIHQESLCVKSANLVDVMSVVVKIADHFSDPQWLARLALLTDITTHLNGLNMKLQGKDILVTDLYTHITAFEVKLRLWEGQLTAGQFVHFPRLETCAIDDIDLGACVGVITSLREQFASRFAGVRLLAADFKLFTAPFDFPVCDAPATLQMGLVELQCNDELKAKFRTSTPLTFFRDFVLPSCNFPNYIAHAQRIVAMFGSTYCCEQLFSKMRHTKSRLRSKLSDCHLNDIFLLSTSSIEPDIQALILRRQHHPSH